ncbi:uncharacterized protein PHACADRAFT_262561 [Phanerochaete carnosa HHB-10118-sp]|uniref:Uncharacterized protein n=1 Tax=Phanerochaete carnosa (strain HHB-10118-sp) TaxID=650164 RepID=K5VZP4_PHACS|nr:uncharacterized protein PHACADRAFT_262561 [Phanerochaete carnosa HHB-10118-sp]EKM52094.1 hypothetical protein PHACADRAFT_262561 [Phanerochaete carnosa HHB-10118-sp]
MCIDGNSGPLSIRYVTAQLEALWHNANDCAPHAAHYDYKSNEYEGSRYIRALREFHFLTRRATTGLREDDLFFSAKFAMPELKFLCNHTVFLRLNIESGHLNLSYKDSAKLSARADHSKNIALKDVEVVFALPILRSNISGRDEKIGNLGARHLVQMMIFALDQEKFVRFTLGDNKLSDDAKEAFQFYLKHYLLFLQTSGNHVMFDLADFDDSKHRPRIDYSVLRTESTDELRQLIRKDIRILDKVDPALIAQFYQMHWQNACGKRNGPAWGKLDLCLATICSDWINGCSLENIHFFINFHSPTVEPLCNQEVIIKFHIKELGFFEKAGINDTVTPKVDLSDQQWQFAFIVKCVRAEGLGVVTLDLDTARFSRFDSFFGNGEPDEQTKHYIDLMIKFFSHDYIDILARFSLHIILGLPLAPDSFGRDYAAEWTETEENEGDHFARKHTHAMMWSERIQHTPVYPGCHEVVALSEETINRVLRSRLETVREWQIGNLFSINILDLKVRLLTSGKAIIYIQANGMIAVRKREKSLKWWTRLFWMHPQPTDQLDTVDFEAVTLAYEVDISKVPHDFLIVEVDTVVTDYYKTWTSRFVETLRRGTDHSRDVEQTITVDAVHLMHFILNLKGARYVEELSIVTDLGTDDTSLEKLNTIRQYIPEYLAALTHYGHNILHTVPICKLPRTDKPSDLFAFTDVDHRVLTKKEINIDTCLNFETLETEIPLVVIYGVTGGARMPTFSGKWAAGWQAVGRESVGTLGLSREIFLQRYILEQLKNVNAMTTIIPKNVDVVDDVWHVDLTTWYLHPTRNQSKVGCQWKPVKSESLDFMEYEWKYRDEWNHEHEGHSEDTANGEYYLHCNTKNSLIIPTMFDPKGIELDLRGETTVKVGGKHNGQKWSRSTVGTWGAKIKLDTSNGLKIVVDRIPIQVKPTVETCTDSWTFDPSTIHFQNLSLKSDALDGLVIGQLRHLLEASWEYCVMGIQSIKLRAPVITRDGDFICELDLDKDMVRPPMLDVAEWVKYRTRWYSEWVENGKLKARDYGQIRGEYTVDKDGRVDTTPVADRGVPTAEEPVTIPYNVANGQAQPNGTAAKAVDPAPAPTPAKAPAPANGAAGTNGAAAPQPTPEPATAAA